MDNVGETLTRGDVESLKEAFDVPASREGKRAQRLFDVALGEMQKRAFLSGHQWAVIDNKRLKCGLCDYFLTMQPYITNIPDCPEVKTKWVYGKRERKGAKAAKRARKEARTNSR